MNSLQLIGEYIQRHARSLIIYQTILAIIFGVILVTLLALLTALIAIGARLLFNYEYIPNLSSIESVKHKQFDYVIIGAGTSGSVLAYELSKHSNYTVLLIEAGGIFNWMSIVPITSTLMQGTEMDFKLKSTSQKFSSRGLGNKQQALPRGKGLGGTHQLNYLLHYSGLPGDFKEPLKYDDLKCFLKRHDKGRAFKGCQFDNDSPTLSIKSVSPSDSPLADAFMKSQRELRKTFNSNVTFQLAQFTSRKGIRHSVFHEYLRRAYQHKNLDIIMHATAERIEFNEKKEAISVIVSTSSQVARVKVKKEVILAAGAFHSPLILMRSGIGDTDIDNSVNLIHRSPAVGRNLFDHMNFPLFVSINTTASVTKDKILSAREIYRYLVHGSGILATTAVIGAGRVNDYGVILFGMGSADEQALKDVANFETETFRAFFPLHANASQEGFVALSTCLLPRSRGRVRMKSNFDVSIDPAYLSDDYDMECMRNAIRLNVRMIKSKAFQRLGAKIHWPHLKACQNFGPFDEDFPTDRYLDCILRYGALTAHHPGGTCAIGKVIDENFKVIGVEKVRVADGSVLPNPVSGFPNSIIIAIAELASKIILRQSN